MVRRKRKATSLQAKSRARELCNGQRDSALGQWEQPISTFHLHAA